jgi:hypothetical protein
VLSYTLSDRLQYVDDVRGNVNDHVYVSFLFLKEQLKGIIIMTLIVILVVCVVVQ